MKYKNKLIIAAAGSGKTTFLVERAEEIKNENVLITTFTEANAREIRDKFTRGIPSNITVQTWFSFLLQHGVRPYQSAMDESIHETRIGFLLTNEKSGFRFQSKFGPRFWGEDNFKKYYFTADYKIYSDKISKFIFECNKKTNDAVIDRINRIYPHIFIDEVQDLAGWDLELLRLFFKSKSKVLLVGDPRQTTYLTNHGEKHKPYRDGLIKQFIVDKCTTKREKCEIDEHSLNKSHRNNKLICAFASALYPKYPECPPCTCNDCHTDDVDHQGIFVIKREQVSSYIKKYKPQVLRERNSRLSELNYGESKGLSFDRVLIEPTEKIRTYLTTGDLGKIETIRAKFYVAVTRARYSATIILDEFDESELIEGVSHYKGEGIEN
ncbi:MAG: UvrD-helicase domain-containing protein [Epulopiscium sp.]|nr:UvrD-helicase domain-containing protein [Candidatus Epulonipiscium sp.]